ncbi:MAG TPA: cadherin repeat domain-containing protein [Ohtaekwangia sp.]|uniref:cadherin repeat domain-containing protein n=1 Tax=Ohtaekwangia sp. TaxID=2066019 RepID=UPI002F95FD21
MNIFTWRQAAFFVLLSALVVVGCKDEETPPVITASDFEVTVDENLPAGTELGSLTVATDKGTLTLSIQSQSVTGAINVDATSGKLSVGDAAKFDYETNPVLTAVVLAQNEGVEKTINVKVNLQKVIWEGANLTFTKDNNADWTIATVQDKITDKVILTRQNKGPIYNYQWWQNNFSSDATYNDLYDDFWNDTRSEREFTREGGTIGIRWAILDNTGASTDTWDKFELYGTLGDPAHFYSLHNIASILTQLESGVNVTGVPDNFSIEMEGGEVNENAGTNMPLLVGKKLGVWLVEEDIYFTLTFTKWGADGDNGISYTRSTKD